METKKTIEEVLRDSELFLKELDIWIENHKKESSKMDAAIKKILSQRDYKFYSKND